MMRRLLCLVLALILAAVSASAGVTVSSPSGGASSPIYDFTTEIIVQDDFLSGNTSNGTVGALGWTVSGGSTTIQVSEANETGIIRRDTSASSGTVAYTSLSTLGGLIQSSATSTDLIWRLRLNSNDANTTVRVGAFANINAVPPADGIYFEKADADTNWQCVTRIGGATQTKTDSGVAVDTNFHRFRYVRTGTASVVFYLDTVQVCSHTTNLPSNTIMPTAYIRNAEAASKTMDMGYFQLTYSGITR